MAYNPALYNPYYQQGQMPAQQPQYQPLVQPQQGGRIMVGGEVEAQNRLVSMYPPHMLVPGFVSDVLWDVNGKQFYTLSIEPDGSRNFETFDYSKHVEQQQVAVTRDEFDALKRTVEQMGAANGLYGYVSQPQPVPATAATDTAATGDAAANPRGN